MRANVTLEPCANNIHFCAQIKTERKRFVFKMCENVSINTFAAKGRSGNTVAVSRMINKCTSCAKPFHLVSLSVKPQIKMIEHDRSTGCCANTNCN